MQCDALRDLEDILSAHPQATIFFDNVLGQHVYRVREFERAERDLNRIAQRLAGRDWGSVHDLYSGPVNPKLLPAAPIMSYSSLQQPKGPSVDGVIGTPLHRRLLNQVGGCDEWMDHVTAGVFPIGVETRLLAWSFMPKYAHWLQAGWISAG
jgi:hypothetical protein